MSICCGVRIGEEEVRALAVLDLMRVAATPLSTGQIAQLASLVRRSPIFDSHSGAGRVPRQLTHPTVGRHLRRLQESGLVRRSGGAARDPYATWSAV